ncbi:hypothetical protein [Pseudoduganella umbonata]|uniref:Uncharacterized protein n=1 Tax=Pseudoduganella umbonata TaxID=864828 RepID=A0A4P8HMJ6_9BURK|nr:hypothetical protein [Pseudoduganella umbonata]MBB3222544.1 hypothetical protein [Pseudoduganella umbonata]QCP10929.1 hypothetical protein FCL38_11225 [Pseudoduganella umbonata]
MDTRSFARAEKVGVAQIRIRKAEHSTAVLGSFIAADRLLKTWAASRDCSECEFEIRYLDGYCLSGRYPMWQKSTTRQSLGAHVRRLLAGTRLPATLHFAPGSSPDRFLDQYEVEDFAES